MNNDSSGNKGLRLLFLSLILITVTYALVIKSTYSSASPGEELTLNQVYNLATAGRIDSATLLDEDSVVVGDQCPTPIASAQASCAQPTTKFHTLYPRSDVATQQIIERLSRNATVHVDKQSNKAVAKLLITFVFPLVLLANLFGIIFLWKGGDNSMADIAGFGAIGRKRKRERHSSTAVTFANVAGAEEAIAELREVTSYLTNPEQFKAYGAAAPKGVLLFGSPGCGKTLLARAVAGESNVPFFSVSGAEFVESLVGVGAARVRDLFRQVREVAPAIVFIDEIDAVGRRRGGEGSTGGEREQTVNQLLVEMDGFDVTQGIVLMGATNRPDILDPALLRPGRFDRHITIEPPDINGRRAILELHGKDRPMAPDVDFEFLARRTPGFSGADLANVINEAALLTIRGTKENGSQADGQTEPGQAEPGQAEPGQAEAGQAEASQGDGSQGDGSQGDGSQGTTQISFAHLTEAIQRVMHGPQRRGKLMSAEERERIAFHESGHAVVAAAFGKGSEVQRVSIVARGRGLGQSVVSDDSDRVLLTAPEIEAQLAAAMGGVASEVLQFGGSSTTAEDDIERATELAKEMVGMYGMSPELGRVRLLSKFDGYLGAEATLMESLSPETRHAFDNEVKRLIDLAEVRAKDVLVKQRACLEQMVQQLKDEETLEGPALEGILNSVEPRLDLLGVSTNGARGDGARKPPAKRAAATRSARG